MRPKSFFAWLGRAPYLAAGFAVAIALTLPVAASATPKALPSTGAVTGVNACNPPSDYTEPVPAKDATLVKAIVATYESASYLNRALGIPMELRRNKVHLDPDKATWAYACPVSGGGGKRVASCLVHFEPEYFRQSRGDQIVTIAHEVYHCFQFSLFTFDKWQQLSAGPAGMNWIIEGEAEYAGATIASQLAHGYIDPKWKSYIEIPTGSVFGLSYDALGFYNQLNSWEGYSVWTKLDAVIKAAGDAIGPDGAGKEEADKAAYDAAMPADPTARQQVIDSWASSYFRLPALDPEWDITGPGVPGGSVNARDGAYKIVGLVNGKAINLPDVEPYANDLALGTPQADVVELHVDKGSVRLDDPATGDDEVLDDDVALCTRSDGCKCPGHEVFDGLEEPGKWYIGVNGGTAKGAKVSLSGESLADYCAHLPPAPPDPSGGCVLNDCGQAGGDAHLYTFDGGRYDFQGAGEFTLIKSTRAGKTPFEVQERLQNLASSGKEVTWPTAVAMRVGANRVGFYAASEGTVNTDVTVRVNNRPVKITAPLRLPGGGSVKFAANLGVYTVTWPDGSIVYVWALVPWLEVTAELNTRYVGHVAGLLGVWNGRPADDLATRAGKLLRSPLSFTTMYKVFGNSWRITQPQSLFFYAKGQSTATFTNRSVPLKPLSVSSLTPDQRANGADACGDTFHGAGINYEPYLDDCIIDVGLTGQTMLAPRWLAAEEHALIANFTIKIGAAVAPGAPRDAGDLATPGAEQAYHFLARAGQTVKAVFHANCNATFGLLGTDVRFELLGPSGAVVFGNGTTGNLCSGLGPFTVTKTGTYTLVVDPLFPGALDASKATGQYGFSLLLVHPVRTFPISVGTTVKPGTPKAAGDLTTPYSEQVFTFAGTAGQQVTLHSLTACRPGTASEEDTWTLGTERPSGGGVPFAEVVLSQPLCRSLGTIKLTESGTWAVVVNAPETLGQNYFHQWIWGPQPGTGTFSFSLK
jgi:hypothetical protein